MKRILYISYDGMTDPLGQSQVLPYLKGLSDKGHKITLLTFEKPERYFQQKKTIEQLVSNAGINWIPLKYTANPPIISAIIDYRKMVRKAIELHKQLNFDITHCRGYLPAMAGAVLQKKFKTKLLFDMRGFWADERAEGGIWPRKNPVYNLIYKYFKAQEEKLLQNSDAVISLTRAGKNIIQTKPYMLGMNDNITVIPCCADFDHFTPDNVNANRVFALRKELNIDTNDIVLSYLGSIGTWYMLPEMLRFFKVLLQMHSEAKMLFITRDDEQVIRAEALRQNIDANHIICRGATRNDIPNLLSLSTFSVFFIKPVFSKQASSPTKLAEILGMGIPVIANAGVGDVDALFERHFPDQLVRNFTDDAYKKSIEHLLQNQPTSVHDLRTIAQKHFSLTNGIEKYHATYNSL